MKKKIIINPEKISIKVGPKINEIGNNKIKYAQ